MHNRDSQDLGDLVDRAWNVGVPSADIASLYQISDTMFHEEFMSGVSRHRTRMCSNACPGIRKHIANFIRDTGSWWWRIAESIY